MLTIAQCRKILGETAHKWSDEELEEVVEWLSNVADLIITVLNKTIKDEKESNNLH
jgi:hypothetical protein